MSRAVEDTALLQAPIPLGKDGVPSIVDFWRDATHEVKNLLANECDIIFQCRICDNFFRSLLNFISHKRTFCRTLYGLKNEANLKAYNHLAEEISGHLNAGEENHVIKKPRGLLKRTSIVGMLNKRIEHCKIAGRHASDSMDIMTLPRISKSIPLTTFDHGEQVLETMPQQLAFKELIPKTRTALVIPQDNNVQYREMNLRRRDNNQKDNVIKEITAAEVDVLCLIESLTPGLVDIGSLRCLHNSCKLTRSFFSIFGLAYHISVKHNYRSNLDKSLYCFICSRSFPRYGELISHLEEVHENVYEEHYALRAPLSLEKDHKKYRKAKAVPVNVTAESRSRSLSPIPVTYVPDDNFNEDEKNSMESSNGGFLEVSKGNFGKTFNKIRVGEVLERDSIIKNRRVSDDERSLIAFRSGMLQTQQTLATSQPNRARELNQIIRFLQLNSKSSATEELEMKHCKQAVLDCIESIVDKVCDMEMKKSVKNVRKYQISARGSKKYADEKEDFNSPSSDTEGPNTSKTLNTFEVSNSPDLQSIFNGESIVRIKSEEDQMSNSAAGSSITGSLEIFKSGSCEVASVTDINENSFQLRERCSSVGNLELDNDFEMDSFGAASRHYKKRKREVRQRRMANLEKAREARKAILGVKISEEIYDSSNCLKDNLSQDDTEKNNKEKTERGMISFALNCRPARHRRKPNWIDEDSFMTLSYGKKRRRREEIETSTSKDGINPGNLSRNSEELMDFVQNVNYSIDNLVCESRTMECQSDSSSTRTYCSSYSYGRPDSAASLFGDGPTLVKKAACSSYHGNLVSQNRDRVVSEPDNTEPSTSLCTKVAEGRVNGTNPDPAKTPIYLTEAQRELLFSFIIPTSNSGNNLYKCAHCGITFPDIKEGRLHAVGHIRIIRLRCSLCGSGSFYCSAMRDHLRMRHCPMLYRAPKDYVLPLGLTPCMSYKNADSLIEIVDKAMPGRITFTPGKIISSARLTPHLPDPKIEKRILKNKKPSVEGLVRTYDALHIKLET